MIAIRGYRTALTVLAALLILVLAGCSLGGDNSSPGDTGREDQGNSPGPQDQEPVEQDDEGAGSDSDTDDNTGGEIAESESFRVETPEAESIVRSPIRIKGAARVFEGVFHVDLEDGHNVLLRHQFQVEGAPAWGEFDVELEFDAPSSPNGMLIFYYHSAKDGSRIEELVIPVQFHPDDVEYGVD